MSYAIDGMFLAQRPTGTQRYSKELLAELDKLCVNLDVEIVVPEWYIKPSPFNYIKIVKYGRLKGIPWEQIDFCRYLVKTKRYGIFLNNVVTILRPKGIVAIHDVCYKKHPEFYLSLRDKVSMMWHRLNYWRATHSEMKIITVSEFSKKEIIDSYGVDHDRITIIRPAWQHMRSIRATTNIEEKYPQLIKGKYYFSLSTLGANKNFKWILYAAKSFQDKMFVIAGGGKLKGVAEAEGLQNLPNINFLGYVDDEDIKALMENCKGFIFPTLYEGFGLTPLEAIASGATEIIVSDTPCMHEIYGNHVSYLDPFHPEQWAIKTNIEESVDLLNKYSWKESATVFYNLLLATW